MPGKWGGARRARPPLDPPMVAQVMVNLHVFFSSRRGSDDAAVVYRQIYVDPAEQQQYTFSDTFSNKFSVNFVTYCLVKVHLH